MRMDVSTRPDGVGVETQRRLRAKGLLQRDHGVGFFVGRHDAALELDGLEAELGAHGLRFGDDAVGVERGGLARRGPAGRVGVGAKAETAARAFVLVKEVGGKIDAIPHAPTEQIADGATHGLAHDVIAGDFDGAVDVRQCGAVSRASCHGWPHRPGQSVVVAPP